MLASSEALTIISASRINSEHGKRYINIRAKLLIKRFLCKINWLNQRGLFHLNEINQIDAVIWNGNDWEIRPDIVEKIQAGHYPRIFTLLAVGTKVRSLNYATPANIGIAGVRDLIISGFNNGAKPRRIGISNTAILFYSIGMYIRARLTKDYYMVQSLPTEFQLFINDECAKYGWI